MRYQVSDWDDAYANAPNIPDGAAYPDRWAAAAAAFRQGHAGELDIAYGPEPRNRIDLFPPAGEVRGLAVFIHGGFWLRFDKSWWSHLAAGGIARGWAVALPSYTLAPAASVDEIVAEVAQAIEAAAARVPGPIRLTGHSVGGHLAARMIAAPSPLAATTLARVAHVVSISGVHDLRPLLRTAMNEKLGLTAATARAASPALLDPVAGKSLTAWVGGAERAEFRRQNALLANIWRGCNARTLAVEEPDRHHFNVIEGLSDPNSPLMRELLRAETAP